MSLELPIAWPADGLVSAVIQDEASRDVLMVGYMNREALEKTRDSGLVHFWSRSRGKLWKKGESSGHLQHVRDIYINCEQNSLLIEVQQDGAVCHDGYPTCYYRRLEPDNSLVTVRERYFDPIAVYGPPDGPEALLRRWWGAYAYLKDNDLAARSGTSRALRSAETSVASRVRDELGELAGVLDGTHIHTSQAEDLVLEASQVCYWIAVESLRRGFTWDDVRPDEALVQDDDQQRTTNPETLATLVKARSQEMASRDFSPSLAHDLFRLTGAACRALDIDPLTPIRADLDELKGRDYLSPYFAR